MRDGLANHLSPIGFLKYNFCAFSRNFLFGLGPILKNERAQVRGFLHRWLEKNSALWFPSVRTRGIARCIGYTATGRRSSPRCSAHSMGNASSLFGGPNFEMLPPRHRTLCSTHRTDYSIEFFRCTAEFCHRRPPGGPDPIEASRAFYKSDLWFPAVEASTPRTRIHSDNLCDYARHL